MTGPDFIDIAAKLTASTNWGSDESRHRTAVSRAYYGAFHSVCALLREWGIAVRRSSYGHQDAHDLLWQSGHELARGVASLLDHLRSARIRADYRLDDRQYLTPSAAKSCVESATDLLRRLDQCRADATEIKAAIEKSQTRDT